MKRNWSDLFELKNKYNQAIMSYAEENEENRKEDFLRSVFDIILQKGMKDACDRNRWIFIPNEIEDKSTLTNV